MEYREGEIQTEREKQRERLRETETQRYYKEIE